MDNEGLNIKTQCVKKVMKRKNLVCNVPATPFLVGKDSNLPSTNSCDSLSCLTNTYPCGTLNKSACNCSSSTQSSSNYLTHKNTSIGSKSVEYSPTLQAAGKYEVYLWWPTDASGATNVPVDITTGLGTTTVTVN